MVTLVASQKKDTASAQRRSRPAVSADDQEDVCIGLAMSLAEQQLRDGTAPSQIISKFIDAGSRKMRLELEKLRKENELLKAKTEALQSEKRIEDLYIKAISAMREYGGQSVVDPNA